MNLVDIMPHRVTAFINADDWYTKYLEFFFCCPTYGSVMRYIGG